MAGGFLPRLRGSAKGPYTSPFKQLRLLHNTFQEHPYALCATRLTPFLNQEVYKPSSSYIHSHERDMPDKCNEDYNAHNHHYDRRNTF